MKKKIIAIALTGLFLFTCIACSKPLSAAVCTNIAHNAINAYEEEKGHTADSTEPDSELKDVELASYDSDVILGKRRCEKNGYHYEINDFSHVIAYDNYPTLKIETYFDYDREGKFVEKIRNTYEAAMGCLPESVQKLIKDTGVTVCCVLDIKAYWTSSNAPDMAGMYVYGTNTLYVACGSYAMLSRFKDSTLYHELGHAVDAANGRFSSNPDFIAAFNEERDTGWLSKVGGRHSQYDAPSEAFAGLFQKFMYTYANPNLNNGIRSHAAEEQIPKLYAFMIETVGLPETW